MSQGAALGLVRQTTRPEATVFRRHVYAAANERGGAIFPAPSPTASVIPHGEEARRRQVYAACVDLAALPSPDDASHRRENHEASGRRFRASSFETLAGASSSG